VTLPARAAGDQPGSRRHSCGHPKDATKLRLAGAKVKWLVTLDAGAGYI
jgi:hypothetical protein